MKINVHFGVSQDHRLGRVACPRSLLVSVAKGRRGAGASHPSQPVILANRAFLNSITHHEEGRPPGMK